MVEDIGSKVNEGLKGEEVRTEDLQKIEPPQTGEGEFSFKSSLVRPDKGGCMSALGVLGGIGVGISYLGPKVYEIIVEYS